ncbi:hypothetical protein AMS68_004826 [Peltaster fructicola]|uniref:Potassium channel domain-containing protein n=1 Tax=Peltaster fructicola TaxID=286661 RepID=A0A6H0XXG4_9PEZI|nr:hypothetical protein AMS68_004826 [Peltaster fructicola]
MSAADTGNEGRIKQAAQQADQDQDQDGSTTQDYTDSGEYWTWSTLSPLLAGTFGPMATAFSICALVYGWREYLPPGTVEADASALSDPHWLIAINALSLAAALAGNLALLLNMAARLRFTIAQPITIGGFYLASVLLIADMAALTSSGDYRIDWAPAEPSQSHTLTSAFYYATFAAGLYFIIASLMCLTVYGANKRYYDKSFSLSRSQRTLMLQTMSFFIYLLLGALVWSKIEGWKYLDAVYWADTTLLTVGTGDFYPQTAVGQGLLFPFAIGGILILGLVVGSIRTLVLERGEEKMAAKITEKRRDTAINHVDVKHQTIKIGILAKAQFVIKPNMLPAHRRGEEFQIMRKVQLLAERERRYMALAMSGFFTCVLWFIGAVIFARAEVDQDLEYLDWLFFSYVSLLTIGYGTPAPTSNFGKAFFVFWSLLAVPSLTILISNMGDTVVKGVQDLTDLIASITVLPGDKGFRATLKLLIKRLSPDLKPMRFTGPGVFGDWPTTSGKKMTPATDWENHILDRLADRMSSHITPTELKNQKAAFADESLPGNELDRDIGFYHYVLSREIRDVMKDLGASPPKKYSWGDWEYFIKLMGNDLAAQEEDHSEFPGQDIPDLLVPDHLAVHRSPTDTSLGSPKLTHVGRDEREALQNTHTWKMPWSWLSNESPLMCARNESEWIMERLSAALERELNRTRRGYRRKPPISYRELSKYLLEKDSDATTENPEDEKEKTENDKLQRAALSED